LTDVSEVPTCLHHQGPYDGGINLKDVIFAPKIIIVFKGGTQVEGI
jgi:hypothetical protein